MWARGHPRIMRGRPGVSANPALTGRFKMANEDRLVPLREATRGGGPLAVVSRCWAVVASDHEPPSGVTLRQHAYVDRASRVWYFRPPALAFCYPRTTWTFQRHAPTLAADDSAHSTAQREGTCIAGFATSWAFHGYTEKLPKSIRSVRSRAPWIWPYASTSRNTSSLRSVTFNQPSYYMHAYIDILSCMTTLFF